MADRRTTFVMMQATLPFSLARSVLLALVRVLGPPRAFVCLDWLDGTGTSGKGNRLPGTWIKNVVKLLGKKSCLRVHATRGSSVSARLRLLSVAKPVAHQWHGRSPDAERQS